MKLVIEVPNMDLSDVKVGSILNRNILNAVKNGTPLPKGHGRIADIDKLLEEMRATRTYDIPFALERVKPIIEADKEGENEANN